MCVRYADYLNDVDMLKSFMNVTIDGIKQVVKVGIMFGCTALFDLRYLGNAHTTTCYCSYNRTIIISDSLFKDCSSMPGKPSVMVLLC